MTRKPLPKKKNTKEKLIPVLTGAVSFYICIAFIEALLVKLILSLFPGIDVQLGFNLYYLGYNFELTGKSVYTDLFLLNAFIPVVMLFIELSALTANEKSSFARRVPVLVFHLLANLYLIILMLRGIIVLLVKVNVSDKWFSYLQVHNPDLEARLLTGLGVMAVNFLYLGIVNTRVKKYMSENN
ncbi:MAG: hypothetical protein HUU54_14870 [Ignavibacteriaceae bacterium]|nr:hypothetical protein [Ignavibacteriaceae bacterium]